MQDKEVEKIIQDILLRELDLPDNYGEQDGYIVPSVYIVAPNVMLGDTDKLQIGIQSISSSVISSTCEEKTVDDKFYEIKQIIISDTIQVDIMSRNNDARTRRFEVIAALESTYAKQMQEKWCCRLFQIPHQLNNVSMAEGSANIYRYSITFSVQHKKQYIKEIDYYESFPIELSTDDLKNKKEFLGEEEPYKILTFDTFERPNLTSNGILGGDQFAVASSNNNNAAFRAVDGKSSTGFQMTTAKDKTFIFYNPQSLQVRNLTFLDFYGTNKFEFVGSNDNITYENIYTSDYFGTSGSVGTFKFNVNSPKRYNYHKIIFKSIGGTIYELLIDALYAIDE